MGDAAVQIASYQELLQLPANIIGEIVNGRLETQPRPSPKHALASSSLGDELISPFQKSKGGPGGWWIIDEPELHLGNDVLVPNIAGWQKEKMSVLPEAAWFEVVPDWTCEILSASTAKLDRIEKMPLYAEYGVQYLWIIDPNLRTLEAYELKQGHWLLQGSCDNDRDVCFKPFHAISFSLGSLWDTPSE